MARPPRGRLPGMDRSSEGTGADELPLDLPRVDPIRPRLPRSSVSSRIEPKFEMADENPPDIEVDRRRLFVPPIGPAMRATDPARSIDPPEKVDDPFDYYAMPRADQDPLSRPLMPSSAPPAESEFLTSKYYTPRSDFSASRDPDKIPSASAQTRRMPGFAPDPSQRDEDDTPLHLRHLPSRVRDHLRTEPKMPSVSEPLGSFAQNQPSATQLRARSGVPLPLAPEMRAPVPTDIRVKRHMPPVPESERDHDVWSGANQIADLRQPLDADEFDSSSDEAVTDYDPTLPPFVLPEDRDSTPAYEQPFESAQDEPYIAADDRDGPENPAYDHVPQWMQRTEPVVARALPSDEWAQDDALHALTVRLRKRAVATTNRINSRRGEELIVKMRGLLAKSINRAQMKRMQWQEAKAVRDAEHAARKIATQREKESARAQASAPHVQRTPDIDVPAPVNVSMHAPSDLQPREAIAPVVMQSDPRVVIGQPDQRKFWQFKPRSPRVRVSVEANRAYRRKKQSRLYEDIVAWIVVPPFIVGAIYGGIELFSLLANSPLGKMLSGQ